MALVADGAGGPVTLTTATNTAGGTDYLFHYQPGVSTVAQLETAVAASGKLKVRKAGAAATLQATDAFGATYLSSSPPPLLKRAAARLAFKNWRKLSDPAESAEQLIGQVQSESTDGHSYSLGTSLTTAGLTGEPVIDDTLSHYRRRYAGTTRGMFR
jgi:hypothetical protein